MIEPSANISVEPPCVTYEKIQGQNEIENPGSLPNSCDMSVSAMP